MSAFVHLAVHPSQFPARVQADLLACLRARQLNHKFLYDGLRQTQKWLALHAACSPARTDPDCAATYDRSFLAVAASMASPAVHLVGLGCGGGQKDRRLLEALQRRGIQVAYSPVDVSAAMVLVAQQEALACLPVERCSPFVCDLALADDLGAALEELALPGFARLVTCFGLLPNFEPGVILARLAGVLRPADGLLLSANLAPGPDYDAGIRQVLPLYDNALTRDWLMGFLLDLGVEAADGRLLFRIEEHPAGSGLKRIAARFEFERARPLQLQDQAVAFARGDSLRVFFSYRHTPALVRAGLAHYGLAVRDQWVTASGEEGVFLVQRPA